MNISKAVRCLIAMVSLAAFSAFAGEGQNWLLRVRGIYVSPDESATTEVIGGDVDIDSDTTVDVDLTYFFCDNWAVELMAATTRNGVTLEDTAAGDVAAGSVRLLPPTLTLQYHKYITETVKPYVGAGVNFTHFYDEEVEGAVNDIEYDNAWGLVLQAGVDVDICENWVFNVDVKKVFLETDVTANTALGTVDSEVEINHWIFGVGFGYRF